jgi:hypothetical protein
MLLVPDSPSEPSEGAISSEDSSAVITRVRELSYGEVEELGEARIRWQRAERVAKNALAAWLLVRGDKGGETKRDKALAYAETDRVGAAFVMAKDDARYAWDRYWKVRRRIFQKKTLAE